MSIDWSAYRITLLLYVGVLLFPLSFYFSYSSFSQLQDDTKALNRFTLNSGAMLTQYDDPIKNQTTKKEIETVFKNLRPWMAKNDGEKFYIASKPLLEQYDDLVLCWGKNGTLEGAQSQICFDKAKSIIFSLNNMIVLKQNRIYNIFYVNLFGAMAFLVLLIFFVRDYTYKQLTKQALYDFASKLYSKEYMLATLKEMSAHMKRTEQPLCVLSIDIEELKNDHKLPQKSKDKILEQLGTSLLNTLRNSDVAGRYSNHELMIILPNTLPANVKNLMERLEHHLKQLNYTARVVEYDQEDSFDTFMKKLG